MEINRLSIIFNRSKIDWTKTKIKMTNFCFQIVWLTDWPGKFYIDPALSLILIVLILRSVWPLLQESALILLQTVPTHIQVDAIQRRLLDKVDGVLAVHEFHVWQLAGDRIIASAHIRYLFYLFIYLLKGRSHRLALPVQTAVSIY